MIPALLLLVAFAAAYFGFACLALAMDRNWEQVFGQRVERSPYRGRLLAIGWPLLALAYALCWLRDGASFGSLLWVVLIGAAAMAVAQTLAWRPRWLRLFPAPSLR